MEQLSLKINWRLAENLFYKQGCKEKSTQSQIKREEKLSGQNCAPSRGHRRGDKVSTVPEEGEEEEEEEIIDWRGWFFLGVRGSSHILGTIVLGLTLGR